MGQLIGTSFSDFLLDENNLINDHGTHANMDLSIWKPDQKGLIIHENQYDFLGYFATNNYSNPPAPCGPTFVFQKDDTDGNKVLAPIKDFAEIWISNGHGRPSNLGIYSPVAPSGYIAIGAIAVMDYNHPPQAKDYPHLKCVAADQCVKVSLTKENLIWTDQGSRASKNVVVWLLPNSNCMFAKISPDYSFECTTYDVAPFLMSKIY